MNFAHTFEPRWKFLAARLLGKRVITCDHIIGSAACIIEGAMWKGRIYIFKYHMVEEAPRAKEELMDENELMEFILTADKLAEAIECLTDPEGMLCGVHPGPERDDLSLALVRYRALRARG